MATHGTRSRKQEAELWDAPQAERQHPVARLVIPVYPDVEVEHFLSYSEKATLYRGCFRGMAVTIKVFNLPNASGGNGESERTKAVWNEYHEELFHLLKLRAHPNVVSLVMNFERPQPCIITEFMPGGDLYHFLHDHGRPSPAEALRMALGIAQGLAFLHEHGVMHHNLNSPNILLNASKAPVLAGFGSSRWSINAHTPTAPAISKWPWLAPEVMHGFTTQDSSGKVDVYAFGIIVWELLSGRVPFVGMPVDQVAQCVANGGRPTVSPEWEERDDESAVLVQVMKQCWRQEPAERPTMAEVVRVLQAPLPSAPPKAHLDLSPRTKQASSPAASRDKQGCWFHNIPRQAVVLLLLASRFFVKQRGCYRFVLDNGASWACNAVTVLAVLYFWPLIAGLFLLVSLPLSLFRSL